MKALVCGGGQLGLMLLEAANDLGFTPGLWVDSTDSIAERWLQSHNPRAPIWRRPETLSAAFDWASLAVPESEWVPIERLSPTHQKKLIPPATSLLSARSKREQKSCAQKWNWPTSPWQTNGEDWVKCLQRWPGGLVLKWSEFGYDGKGVCILTNNEDPSKLQRRAQEFILRAHAAGTTVYAEQKIEYTHEIAVVGARTIHGKATVFPPFATKQENGTCLVSVMPSTTVGISPTTQERATQLWQKIAQDLNYVGTLAVEMFVTKEGELLINELAPRVHNSAHATRLLTGLSQFHCHWLAGTDHLPEQEAFDQQWRHYRKEDSCLYMFNLLSPEITNASQTSLATRAHQLASKIFPSTPNHLLEWYGKPELHAGRKMGHIIGICPETHWRVVEQTFREGNLQWQNELKSQ